jgi:hypothetical protein
MNDIDIKKQNEVVTKINQAAFENERTSIELAVTMLNVSSDTELNEAINLMARAKKLRKEYEADRKRITDPINASIKAINAKYKPALDFLEKVARDIDAKIIPYQQEKIRKAEELEREKNLSIASNLVAAGMDDKALEVIEREVIVEKKAVTAEATNTLSKRWVCEIVDAAAVPREYCEVSQTKLNAAVKLGTREIAGCKIYEKVFSVTR